MRHTEFRHEYADNEEHSSEPIFAPTLPPTTVLYK